LRPAQNTLQIRPVRRILGGRPAAVPDRSRLAVSPGDTVPPEYAASVGTSTFGKKAAPPLAERQADFGLGYGLYWLENGGDGGFRWSRRFFGFYLDLEGPAQIELDFES